MLKIKSENTMAGFKRVLQFPIESVIVIVLILLLAYLDSFGMPPHPRVAEKIISGKITAPNFLQDGFDNEAVGLNTGGISIFRKPGMFAKSGVAGSFKILTILVDFSDNVNSVAAVSFDTLVYVDVNGSVNNYYKEVSYNTLSITSPILPSALAWVRAPETYAYYVNNNYGTGSYPNNTQKLVEDLVDAIDGSIDFSQFDNDLDGYVDGLIITHAGPGAEFSSNTADIWSHKWGIASRLKDGVYINTYSINPEYWSAPGDITLGVYCHELGHVFGLPDLYDTDYSSNGIDDWSLMAGGSWNGPSSMGSSPSHPDAWSRIFLGFVTPTVPAYDQAGVSFPQVETNATIYKLWTNGSPANEYFLLENRQKTGYDSYIPGDGMLIWHIDDNKSGNTDEWWPASGNPSHYKVALIQADNLWELDQGTGYGDTGDPYPGITSNTNFTDLTSPNSKAYSGTGTSVSLVNISNSGATMTADIVIGIPQGVSSFDDLLPGKLRLLGNVPNPFNPTTAIKFEVVEDQPVKLEIFSLTGQKIKVLANREFSRGFHSLQWDGKDEQENEVGTGIYFYKVTVDGSSISKKMLKLK